MNHLLNQDGNDTVSHSHLYSETLCLWTELSEEDTSVIIGGLYPQPQLDDFVRSVVFDDGSFIKDLQKLSFSPGATRVLD
jgi:hypothetical protein